MDLRFFFGFGRFLDLPLFFRFRNPMISQLPIPITASPPTIGISGELELLPLPAGIVGAAVVLLFPEFCDPSPVVPFPPLDDGVEPELTVGFGMALV